MDNATRRILAGTACESFSSSIPGHATAFRAWWLWQGSLAPFGIFIWVHPSFWCKRRGSLLIGASQLLITVSALRLASIQPRL